MKYPSHIINNEISLADIQEERTLSDLDEAAKNLKEDKKDDKKLNDVMLITAFSVFIIALIIYCYYIAVKKAKKDKIHNEETKNRIFQLIKRYKTTKNSSVLKELQDFIDLKGLSFESKFYNQIYSIIEELKKIVDYKNSLLSYARSLINPVNKRDYHRKRFRCLYKNLDDEHVFNVILN